MANRAEQANGANETNETDTAENIIAHMPKLAKTAEIVHQICQGSDNEACVGTCDLYDSLLKLDSSKQFLYLITAKDDRYLLSDVKPTSYCKLVKVANPLYNRSKVKNAFCSHVSIKVEVLNPYCLNNFEVRGFGHCSWLRIQNSCKLCWNLLLAEIRRCELNPKCDEIEAPLYDLVVAWIIGDEKDIKLAHDKLTICLKHLSLASNQAKTDEEAATKIAPICDYVEHIAKTCVTNLIWQLYYDNDKAAASTDAVSSNATVTTGSCQQSANPKATASTNAVSSDATTASSQQPADKENEKVEAKEPHFEIFSWNCFFGEKEQRKVAKQNDAQKKLLSEFWITIELTKRQKLADDVLRTCYSYHSLEKYAKGTNSQQTTANQLSDSIESDIAMSSNFVIASNLSRAYV